MPIDNSDQNSYRLDLPPIKGDPGPAGPEGPPGAGLPALEGNDGQLLAWDEAESELVFVDPPEPTDWAEITSKPATFPPDVHTHDDRYYTETEVNTALAGKANTTHAHSQADVTGLGLELSGKANTVHTHAQSEVTGLEAVLADLQAIAGVSGVPYYIPDGVVFTVPENFQALWTIPIELGPEGAMVIDGILVEVS